jgi:hypothetical protein
LNFSFIGRIWNAKEKEDELFNKMMSRNHQEIEKEIRRIEGQLLVAKQICRENVLFYLIK